MKIRTLLFTVLCSLITSTTLTAQSISSKIVDQKTNQPIPYATIQLTENSGIVSNEEGRFSITMNKKLATIDSIYISAMGYEQVALSLQHLTDSIIYITPKTIELNEVFISNKNLTIDEIIENIEDNLSKNYNMNLSKKKLFFRESNYNNLSKIDIQFKKSTIEELNKKLIDSITEIIPRKSAFHTETLCEYYGNNTKQKLNITKAAEIYDKNNDGSMDGLSKKLEEIFKKNVKPNSYLKIKSGIFSQKVQIDSIFEANKETEAIKNEIEKPKENHFLGTQKNTLNELFGGMFFQTDTKLNIINKSRKYNFELIDYTTIDDSSAYIINFNPKRTADFKGTIYVNTENFAIMRIDYQNVKPLKKLKLFGISYEETTYQGKTFFHKGSSGNYEPKLIIKETGVKFGINRPLKVIEKNKHVKGKRKQNELSLELDIIISSNDKYEIIVFDTEQIEETTYTNSTENKNIEATYLSKYDPLFWKGENSIEPNAAIRKFTITKNEKQTLNKT